MPLSLKELAHASYFIFCPDPELLDHILKQLPCYVITLLMERRMLVPPFEAKKKKRKRTRKKTHPPTVPQNSSAEGIIEKPLCLYL